MADPLVSSREINSYSRALFFPLMLMLNFSFFQYLVLLFHVRWREKRVQLLLLVSATSVVALVPFATQSDKTVANLNDASESCLALILLVQTALVGTRHCKGPPARVSKPLQLAADLLIVFDCGVVVLGLVCVFRPHVAIDFGSTATINNVAENLTLVFTFVYRFGELGRSKGWRALVRDDKWEIVFHVVFMLHEYPFMLLENATHVSWEYLQAIFMRLALAPCVWMTIGEHHAQRLSVFLDLQRMPADNVKELLRRVSLAPVSNTEKNNDVSDATNGKSAAVVYAAKDDADGSAQSNECSTSGSTAVSTISSDAALPSPSSSSQLNDAAVTMNTSAACCEPPPLPVGSADGSH